MASFRKRGEKWYVEIHVNGLRKGKTFDTKTQAKEWAVKIEAGQDKFHTTRATIQSIIEKYIKEVSVHHGGYSQEKYRLELIAKEFPEIPIANYKKDIFSAWKNSMLDRMKPGSVRRYMTALNSVLNHAVSEWQYLGYNPLKGVKKPPDAPHRERVPAGKEIKDLIRQFKFKNEVTTKNQEVAVSLLLAIETAMRAGEILSICPDNTDLKKRVVTLTKTKNRDTRKVPLSKEAVRLIKLLPGHKFRVRSAEHSTLFRKAVNAAGIKDLTFHDSRAAGLMRLSKKVDVLTLARIVGHRDIKSLMIYYREKAEDIAKLLD